MQIAFLDYASMKAPLFTDMAFQWLCEGNDQSIMPELVLGLFPWSE